MPFSSAHKQPATMGRAPQHPRRAGVEGLGWGVGTHLQLAFAEANPPSSKGNNRPRHPLVLCTLQRGSPWGFGEQENPCRHLLLAACPHTQNAGGVRCVT